ncbi:carboxy terminal-processing peptidase [Pedobacter borealis]|uniref:carboxy terminal-processing peptidase n=1 Tax=Pedobacter borealis TaxID=475254 RepID=UPI0004935EE2|nr:carboxy terminal-processing peptidase [Pedobacter borealis]
MKFRISLFIISICAGATMLRAQSKKELARFDSIAHMASRITQKMHYKYSSFDDVFSKTLFTDVLTSLDGGKLVFLAEDVDRLKPYETRLDDELNGAPVRFCTEVERLFKKRLQEASLVWTKLLSQPIDLTRHEVYSLPIGYAASKDEQLERLHKWLIMNVEREMFTMQESQGEKVKCSLAELERKAREAVRKRLAGSSYCYLTKMDHEDYFSNYMLQFCQVLDGHSRYEDAKEELIGKAGLGGATCGVGFTLNDIGGIMCITEMAPGGPAEQSGQMKVGDAIISVKDGRRKAENILGYEFFFVRRTIMGEEGSKVTLNCMRPDGSKYAVKLKRAFVNQKGSLINTAVIEEQDKKVGYIILPAFYGGKNDVGTDMMMAVQRLNKEKVDAIVIDLRYNVGGTLSGCLSTLGEFLPNGPALQFRKKDERPEVKFIDGTGMKFSGPLVLLVNTATISCGDMFTMVLQDFNRALIMGAPTAGKTVGQYDIQLREEQVQYSAPSNGKESHFGKLWITADKYYSVTGRSVQLKGVTPDVSLPDYHDFTGRKEIEKKHPIAGDSIPSTMYTAWNFGFDLESVRKHMQQEVDQNVAYKRIAENEEWLKQMRQKPISLNWEEYSTLQKEESMRTKESAALSKLKNKMVVQLLPNQNAKAEEEFVNNISTDLYIRTAAEAALKILKTK